MSTTEEPVALRCAREAAKTLKARLDSLDACQRLMDQTPATSPEWTKHREARDFARLMVVESARVVSHHLECEHGVGVIGACPEFKVAL